MACCLFIFSGKDIIYAAAEEYNTGFNSAVYEFAPMINGVPVSLPIEVSDLLTAGWGIPLAQDTILPPQTSTWVTAYQNNTSIEILVVNTSEKEVALQDGWIGGVRANAKKESGVDFHLAAGVALGSDKESVLAQMGSPSGVDLKKSEYDFRLNRSKSIHLLFSPQDKLIQVEMINWLQDVTMVEKNETLPQEILDYTVPDGTGQNWQNFCVSYGGEFYKLPVPLPLFLENGWELCETEKQVPANGWLKGVQLQRGTQVLFTTLYNSSNSQQPINNCLVGEISCNISGPDIPLELAAGVNRATSWADVVTLYGEPQRVYKTKENWFCTYQAEKGYIRFTLPVKDDAPTGEISGIEVGVVENT